MQTAPPADQTLITPPLHSSGVAADGSVLRLLVQGFNAMERSLLVSVVKLSQRRSPRLELLTPEKHGEADVMMIDTRDKSAMAWAHATVGLQKKPVIWVDGSLAGPGHMLAKRPIQWPNLPMLLSRALEQRSAGRPQAGESLPGSTSTTASVGHLEATPILVVDDSQAVRAHMRSILERLGYRVEEAASAHAALRILTQRSFAVVFMDVMMPELDGYEACKRIKAQQRTLGIVPIVMLTSRNSPFDRIRGKMSGCDGYLTKPAETAALHEVLRRFAGKPAPRPGPAASRAVETHETTVPAPFDSRPAPAAKSSFPVLPGAVPFRR